MSGRWAGAFAAFGSVGVPKGLRRSTNLAAEWVRECNPSSTGWGYIFLQKKGCTVRFQKAFDAALFAMRK